MVQRFRGEKLTDAGTDHGTTIAHAGIRRQACTLEMPVKFAAIIQTLFTQQDTAPVTELTRPDTKLMATVDLRQRLHAGQQCRTVPHIVTVTLKEGTIQPH